MLSIRTIIQKALFYNTQGGQEYVPEEVIIANGLAAGFDRDTIHAELKTMVRDGELLEKDGQYRRSNTESTSE